MEIKETNQKVMDQIYNSRSIYYGIYYYYSLLGEKSNMRTIFEVLDNYFLKRFHENFHSQFLRNLNKMLFVEIAENKCNYMIQILGKSIENAFNLFLYEKNKLFNFFL